MALDDDNEPEQPAADAVVLHGEQSLDLFETQTLIIGARP